MGMGEPLSNYAAVKAAIELMTDPSLFGLARRRVTLSTVGVAPRIRDVARDLPVSDGQNFGTGGVFFVCQGGGKRDAERGYGDSLCLSAHQRAPHHTFPATI